MMEKFVTIQGSVFGKDFNLTIKMWQMVLVTFLVFGGAYLAGVLGYL